MHPLLESAAARQFNLFTAADARGAGYEPGEVQRLLSSGEWARLRRGIYVDGHALRSADARGRHRLACAAVLLALGRRSAAVVSHESAARLWGMVTPAGVDDVVRLTDPERWRRGRGYRVAYASLAPHDLTTGDALPITTTARTLVDCSREWELTDSVVAMDDALYRRLVDRATLHETVLAAKNWPGAAASARALYLADGRAESSLETRGRLRIVASGLPLPELQVEVHDARGKAGVVDGWYDDAAVAIEFDGRIKYTDPWRGRTPAQVQWDENRREDRLRALDIRVVRIADADLGADWPHVVDRLRRLGGTPGPADRRFRLVRRLEGRLRATGSGEAFPQRLTAPATR